MKKFFLLLTIFGIGFTASAQQRATDLDKSPLDVTYFPPNFPILKMRGQVTGDPLARVLYSRPQKKGRSIFGNEVKYNEVWRLGANEATEIELFKNATVGGKKIPKGKYSLFCIPTETKWTLIFNKDNFNWGSFMYKAEKDVARIEVPVKSNNENVEAFTMFFENSGGNQLVILWDELKATVPISFN